MQTGKRVAFLGFKPALPPGRPPDVVRNPLSGSLFAAGPVPLEAADTLNRMLLDRLDSYGDEILTPEESTGALSIIISRDSGARLTAMEIYSETGKAMAADGVLIGYVYRWQERQGTDFAVERPASAAFDLTLINSSNGALMWRGRFDRTQKSLSENLLDLAGFLKRGGRWLKVEDFAASGLDSLLNNYPGL